MLDLVMQPAQHAARRARMIVLHELGVDTRRLRERLAVVALEKEAALVAEHLRLDQQHARERGCDRPHQNTWSSSKCSRYWP
jgi:hypothetical protein